MPPVEDNAEVCRVPGEEHLEPVRWTMKMPKVSISLYIHITHWAFRGHVHAAMAHISAMIHYSSEDSPKLM